MVIQTSDLMSFLNSDLVSGLANVSQFYNVYQSTKAGTYAQLNHDIELQTNHIEEQLNKQTNEILNKTLEALNISIEQNKTIIQQNENIIRLLGGNNDNQ